MTSVDGTPVTCLSFETSVYLSRFKWQSGFTWKLLKDDNASISHTDIRKWLKYFIMNFVLNWHMVVINFTKLVQI